jgi:hypothetical protein
MSIPQAGAPITFPLTPAATAGAGVWTAIDLTTYPTNGPTRERFITYFQIECMRTKGNWPLRVSFDGGATYLELYPGDKWEGPIWIPWSDKAFSVQGVSGNSRYQGIAYERI